jgi:hypothetical protein
MNIIKLQNMLRGVDDDALINYVQNPQGEVPSYLALSELQRRKDTRAKYKAQQAPESSVAEDLQQETMPDQGGLAMLAGQPQMQMEDQGVAGLPVPETMYQDQNFAGGGIVAFADGGMAYPNYEGPSTSAIGRAFGSITGGLKGYINKKSQLMDLQRQIEALQPNLFESLNPSELSTRKAKIAELKAQQDAIRNPSSGSGYVYKEGESAVDPNMASYIAQEKQVQKTTKGPVKTQPTQTQPTQTQPTQTQVVETQTLQQPTESYEDDLRKRMGIYKDFMGSNEDKTKLQEKIDAMEKRAARQEELAPYMALTEAGFKTMAGTSPFALVNLGAGAQAGLQSYGAAQDKMAALEEKRYALMNEAAKADRAEKQAAIMFGENSYQHKAAMDQRERLGQAELNLRKYTADVSTKNAMIAAAKKSDFESFLSLAKEDEDNYKTVKDKDGNVKKIFDVNKATQAYKSFSGSSGLDDDKLFAAYQQEKMMDKNYKKSFQEYKNEIRGQSSVPAANSAGFSNFRISK